MQFADYKPGDSITILSGRKVTCEGGCHVLGESYAEFKGVPLVVLSVDWPYIACSFPVGNGGKVIDARDCELTRCSDEYVNAFRLIYGVKIAATPSPAMADMPLTKPGDDDAAVCCSK